MKKLMITILTVIMILGTSAVSYGKDYSDIKSSNWAYDAVNAMSEKTIVKGYPDGTFKPNNTVTYGEFIKMALIAATGEDVGNTTSGNWATSYYIKALELGYFTEYDISKESLNKQITRAHMALIISFILGDIKIENYDEIQKGITDITYKTQYEYDITKSYAKGILTGYTDKTFKPEKTLSRAEAATVIYRLVDEGKRVYPGTETDTEATKTTAERLQGDNKSGTVNLSESSTSTLLLDSLVTNRAKFPTLSEVTYYEVVKDYPYTMGKKTSSLGVEAITLSNVDYARGAFIIKGNQLTMLEDTAGYIYQVAGVTTASTFPEFDYIGFYNDDRDTMILVPNPF